MHVTHSVNIVINRTVKYLADKCNLSSDKKVTLIFFLYVVRFN